MASFATYSDLEVQLNRTLSSGERTQATQLLAQATSAIRLEAGQEISLVSDDEVVLVGNWGSTLVLPKWPVVDVTVVTLDVTELTVATGYTWDGQRTLYRGNYQNIDGVWRPWPQNVDLYWGGPSTQVTVTYSHGYSTVPAAISGLCMTMALRQMRDPTGTATSRTIGPYSESSSSGTGSMSLTADERRLIRKVLGK
jgi:hypothetical protein